MKKLSFYFLFALFLSSCNSTKHVAEEDLMLIKNYIFVDNLKNKNSDLQKYILQKPNTRLLGMPLGLYFHNLGNHNNPETVLGWSEKNPRSYKFVKNIFSEKQSIAYAKSFIKLNGWLLSYDKPEIINKSKIKRTTDNFEAYYKTQGYFKSKVISKINKSSAKKATVTYTITKGKPTILDSINIKIESKILDSIYKNAGIVSLLKKGNQYKDKTFREEASNVIKLFRNKGIYHFSETALGFYVDSTRTDYKTNVDFIMSGNRLIEENGKYIQKPFKVHKIKEVNVYTDYSFKRKGEKYENVVSYKGINFFAHDDLKYNPKYLSQSIFLKPGQIYEDQLRNLTRTHLKSLKNFKATNIKFETISGFDDALKMNIFLSPLEKLTIISEAELTHSNIREIGISGKFSIANRNVFKGAELLKFSILGSWFNSINGPGWEIGADTSLEIPRFVAPFGLHKLVPKRMSPRTVFSVGTSIQKNIGLDRQTFTFLSDYKWQYNAKKTIQLEIFNTQYIRNLNTSNYYSVYSSEFFKLIEIGKIYLNDNNFTIPNDGNQLNNANALIGEIIGNPNSPQTNPKEYQASINIFDRFNIITSDFLIPTLAYTFTYNNQTNFKDNSFSFFKVRVANSGNVLGLLSNKKNQFEKETVLNIPLAQYFKTDIEYKKFWGISENSVFGFRTFLGVIIPYNNSDIPFTKSYFAGGSNDIRAWQTYELGPGRTKTDLEFNVGNLKFLSSAEYRFDVVGKLKGALFVDAGNIWDITKTGLTDSKENFNNLSSLKDIAVGSGFGARVDFSFLILRLDVGFKTYEPYLSGNKWLVNYNFSNAIYNIGINYPF